MEQLVLRPETLSHPNIPKPLHGMNPRTILGQEWWDKARAEAYASTGFRCIACGVHKSEAKGPRWLEAHEFWDIDYMTGRCEVKSIVPLCHYCHNFIHSGRLSMIAGKEKTEDEVNAILEHGFRILSRNNLECFGGTLAMARRRGVDTFGVKAIKYDYSGSLGWNDFVMVLDGKEYRSKFKSLYDWSVHYSRANDLSK